MQQYILPVNNEALSRALVAVVGEANAGLIVKAYKMIDDAMAFGYQQGLLAEADKHAVDAQAAYDHGFQAGRVHDDQSSYDDGYVDGVADAREWPRYADEQVARLCDQETYSDEDDLPLTLARDSGDEQPSDAEIFDAIVARGEQPEYSRDGERLY